MFRWLGKSPVFSAWFKSCYNVSVVIISIVFNTLGDIFLGVVTFLTFKFFISSSISDWETSVKEMLFSWEMLSLVIWMSFKLFYGSINRIYHITKEFVCDISVYSNIYRFYWIRKEKI